MKFEETRGYEPSPSVVSPLRQWRRTLDQTILPWALEGVELGDDVLEVGSGPGLTTDWLRLRAASHLAQSR